MIRWMNFWIRGSFAVAYQAIFLTALMILLLLWGSRYHNRSLPVLSTVIFSLLAGYGAGLLALAMHPIFQQDGPHQVLMSLNFPASAAALAFFGAPLNS